MKRILLLVFITLLISVVQNSHSQDTTWVQTYTFEEQNDPETAYDSPGRKWFTMPEDDGTEYRKILMYYKLKCFEDGTAGNLGFPCGEWDYLSYTYLFDHTGMLDSTASEHPFYLLDNSDFEFFNYSTEPISDYFQLQTYEGEVDMLGTSYMVGPITTTVENAMHVDRIYRNQILYTAIELTDAGITAGEITGLLVDQSYNSDLSEFRKVQIKSSSATELEDFDNVDFQDVYFQFDENSVSPTMVNFSIPFVWDGVSNILLNIEGTTQEDQVVDIPSSVDYTENNSLVYSSGYDRYLSMHDGDNIEVPAEVFAEIDEEITISLWIYGDEDILPINTYLFEGVNASNQRVINTHLPWSNSRIYWDAGQDGGYDRIDKAASDSEFEGQWNHFAFTKNTVSGEMKIFLNGELWHSGTGKDNSMAGIVKFMLGSSWNSGAFYAGKVDEFRVWKKELDEETIAAWMNKDLTPDHPNYEDLMVNYSFDNNLDNAYLDLSPNGFDGIPQGSPDLISYQPNELFKNVFVTDQRPTISFFQGNSIVSVIEGTETIELVKTPAVLTEWFINGNYVELDNWTNVWVDGVSNTYDEAGNILMSVSNSLDNYIENDVLAYYQPPFEVIDRYELGRFITPYGINLDLEDGWTWIYDVTDFEPFLRGEVELQAGNWQELLDMKFAFIEGTPPRDVIRVENLWNGSFGLTTFDTSITEKEIEVEDGEETFKLKATTTGHGNPGCAEFCYNTHSVSVNGTQQWSWEIMQECADNPLRPQGGTWIYDRAGWCPGAPGKLQEFELTDLVSDQSTFTVDYDCQYESAGNYVFEAQLVTYGAPNFANDVELEEILAPNKMKVKSHKNPMCNKPLIRIRNTGSENLTICRITYGVNGVNEVYEWTGDLAFMEYEDVEVDYTDEQIYVGDTEEQLTFEVTVSDPNNQTDENSSNNYGTSHFKRPPVYTYGLGDDDDNRLVMYLQTNLFPNETGYTIYNDDNNPVFSRYDFAEGMTAYRDTIALSRGCYLLHVEDSDHDGISFWADSDGNGDVRMRKVTTGQFKTFDDDFGKEIYHYFYWDTDLVGIEENDHQPLASLAIYPNPSDGIFNLSVRNLGHKISVDVINLNGELVYSDLYTNFGDSIMKSIDLNFLTNGMYYVQVSDGINQIGKRIVVE